MTERGLKEIRDVWREGEGMIKRASEQCRTIRTCTQRAPGSTTQYNTFNNPTIATRELRYNLPALAIVKVARQRLRVACQLPPRF